MGYVLGNKAAWPRRAREDEADIVSSHGLGQPTSCLSGCRVNKGVNIAGPRLPALEGPPCKVGPGLASRDVAPEAFPNMAGALYLNCLYKQCDLWLTSAFLLGVWNTLSRRCLNQLPIKVQKSNSLIENPGQKIFYTYSTFFASEKKKKFGMSPQGRERV